MKEKEIRNQIIEKISDCVCESVEELNAMTNAELCSAAYGTMADGIESLINSLCPYTVERVDCEKNNGKYDMYCIKQTFEIRFFENKENAISYFKKQFDNETGFACIFNGPNETATFVGRGFSEEQYEESEKEIAKVTA